MLDSFWFHDDWFFLSNAAGITQLEKGGSRWLSYVGYWKLLYPLFGLNTLLWAATRLLLHAGSSWFVVRIGKQSGLGNHGSYVAGLLFAGASVAFESVYWGTGAIELMGVFFSLVAIDQWLRGHWKNILVATLAGIIAINSKEIGFLLPVLFLANMAKNDKARNRVSWISVTVLVIAATISGLLLFENLDGSSEYSLALSSIPQNFLILGFWLFAPPAFQTGNEIGIPWALGAGAVVWVSWVSLALWDWRKRGGMVPLVSLVICILAMVPVLPLDTHIVPRYDYGPVAAAVIGLTYFMKDWLNSLRFRWFFLASIIVVILTFGSTHYRINSRFPNGRPVHRLVVKEEISRKICGGLKQLPLEKNDTLVFFLEPTGNKTEEKYLREALGDELGPQVLLGNGIRVKWVSELSKEDEGSFVVSVDGMDLKPMGRYQPRS